MSAALFDVEMLKKKFKIAKSREVHFAFGAAQKKENDLLVFDLKLPGERLAKEAKKIDGKVKVSFGSAMVDGSSLVLITEKAVSGMRKRVELKLKGVGLKATVKLRALDGTEIEDLDEDEGAEIEAEESLANDASQPVEEEDASKAQAEAEEAEAEDDARADETYRTEFEAIKPALQQLARVDASLAASLSELHKTYAAALKGHDWDACERALGEMRRVLAEGQGDAQARRAEYTGRFDALVPELKGLAAQDAELRKLLQEEHQRFKQARDGADWETCEEILEAMETVAAEAKGMAAPPPPPPPPPPPSSGARQGGAEQSDELLPEEVRERWRNARASFQAASEAVDRQISALQKILRASDDEDLEVIAEFGLNGVTGNFKTPLMAAMVDLDTSNAAIFRRAAAKALTVIGNFRKHIDADEAVAACDDNPFGVKVTIRDTLGGALADMESTLKAA